MQRCTGHKMRQVNKMDLALITIEKITGMFLIMMTGVAAYHWRILDSYSNKRLSGLLLNVVAPATLFMSYQIEFQPERLKGLLITLALSLASYVWVLILINFLIPLKKGEDAAIEQLAVIYSNCGFIGIPLVNGILGTEGVFYLTAYITALNLMIWSHGQAVIRGMVDGKRLVKNFIQPCTVAIGLGILFYVLRIRIPEVGASPLTMVGDMNTPMAMLVAGCSLAESNLVEVLKEKRIYWICFLKLLLIPAVSILILSRIPVEKIYIMTIITAISCPTAATGSMFAIQYNKNSQYASELFTMATVLSLLTIPLMILLAGWLL